VKDEEKTPKIQLPKKNLHPNLIKMLELHINKYVNKENIKPTFMLRKFGGMKIH
jgi:hypothetical protein